MSIPLAIHISIFHWPAHCMPLVQYRFNYLQFYFVNDDAAANITIVLIACSSACTTLAADYTSVDVAFRLYSHFARQNHANKRLILYCSSAPLARAASNSH